MKFKLVAALTVGCVMATVACAQAEKTYWVRSDNTPLNLADPQTLAQLDQAMAACTVPGDEPSAQHSRDFEGCMLSKGWKPHEIIHLQAADTKTRPASPINMTADGKRQFDAGTHAARQDGLINKGAQITLGIQGYHDRYNEPSPGVNVETHYFGLTAAYGEHISDRDFWMIDGRADHGTSSYNSPSGTLSGVPEYEGELRLTGGRDYAAGENWFSPYAGLGTRIFRDNGKGYVTNLGAHAYDRRIEQLYIPLGATFHTLLFGRLSMADTLEIDPLLVGRVNSRLGNVGDPNSVVTQDPLSGYGIRGDIMFGLPMQDRTFEIGPFFRYWNINDSEPDILTCAGPLCNVLLEPYNKRLQVGMNARVSF